MRLFLLLKSTRHYTFLSISLIIYGVTVIVTLVLEHCFTIARILGSIIGCLVVAFLCYELSDVTSMNTRLVITGAGTVITILLNLTVTDAARMLGVNRKALSEFVNVKASLSPEMAIRISKATNTSPESWMNMQQKLTRWIAQQNEPSNVIPFPLDAVKAG